MLDYTAFRQWFFGKCARCEKTTAVTSVRVDKESTPKPRCAFCVWRIVRNFKWKRWVPEDSKLNIGRPVIYGADGNVANAHR